MNQISQQPNLEYSSNSNSYIEPYSSSSSNSDSSLGADLLPPLSLDLSLLSSLDLLLSKPSITSTSNSKHSIRARIQAITYLELGLPHFQITAKTGVSKSQIYKLREKALAYGWDPATSTIVEIHHVDDSPRSGRPKASKEIVDLVLEIVTKNSTTRS